MMSCDRHRWRTIIQAVEPLKVFVSSVMRRSLENLSAEREAARSAIEHLNPIACAWSFENEPASTKRLRDSYIDEVKSCDLMVLIVGSTMTLAVRDEVNTARDHSKGILAFASDLPGRGPEAAELLRVLDSKYDSFVSADDLGPKVRNAVAMEIRRRAKPEGVNATGPGNLVAQLREFKRTRTVIRVTPLVPHGVRDLFRLEDVQADALILDKSGSGERVTIPLGRVVEILKLGSNEAPLVRIEGRLQWLTVRREWRFCHDGPERNDPFHLGVAREVGRDCPFVTTLNQQSCPVSWSRRDLLAGRIAARTHEVFYDDEGYYLQSVGAVLIMRT